MHNKILYQKPLKEQEKLIFLYCFIDDLLKQISAKSTFPKLKGSKRGRNRRLALSEIITLGIFRMIVNIPTVKDYHKFLLSHYDNYFNLPNYQNFNSHLNNVLPYIVMILNVMTIFTRKNGADLHFMDSTPLPVCKNKRIYTHKVAKELAQRSKSTMGWFYGFKLHIICNESGGLESIKITPGNVYDGHMVDNMAKDILGKIIADAGYVGVNSDCKNYHFISSVRKNMKKLMTTDQHKLLKRRQLVESVFSVIKERIGIVTSLARSLNGLFSRYAICLLAYFFIQLR